MQRWRCPLLLAAFLAVPLLGRPAAAEEPTEEETQQLLQYVRKDPSPALWLAAVRTLKQGSEAQRQALAKALASLVKQRLPALRREVASLNALASHIGDGASARRLVEAWDAKRLRAVRWVFDPVSFPDPPHGVVNGPMRGSAEARRRCAEAEEAYAALARRLNRALRGVLKLDYVEAQDRLLDYGFASRNVYAIVREMQGLAEVPVELPRVSPTALTLLDTRLRRFDVVARVYQRTADPWLKLCLFHAYGHGLLAANADRPRGMSEKVAETVRRINELRMALGISPVGHNGRLSRMARAHTAEMNELGYWSHRSPVQENHTCQDRAHNVRYAGEVTECLALTGSPAQAFDIWYWDGAHFRGLVHPHWRQAGMSNGKPITWNAGSGDSHAAPGLTWGWPQEYSGNR